MKYIVDDRKILDFLFAEKMNLTTFAQKINVHPSTLNRALDGIPIMLATAQKIAKGMGLHPHAIILASIAPKEEYRAMTDAEHDKMYEKMREWYLSK